MNVRGVLRNESGGVILRYQVEAQHMSTHVLGNYNTYGIRAERRSGDEWVEIKRIDDITTNILFAKQMAALFTVGQLSCRHFMDAVEDMLP
jgi:hypothetical protein